MSENERLKKTILWLISQGNADSQEELSKSLGYNPSSISQIVTGKKPISNKFLKKLGEFSEKINTDWIQFGKGSMLKDIDVSGSHNMVGSSGTMNNIVLNAKKIIDRKADGSVTIKAAATDEERNAEDYLSEIEQLRGRIAELELSLEAEKRAGRNMQDLILRMQKGE